MSFYIECLEKFKKLPAEVKEKIGSFAAVKTIEEIEAKAGKNIDLKFLVIMVAIGYLDIKNISKYLTLKYKLTAEQAEEIKSLLISKVFSQLLPDTDDIKSASNENVAGKIEKIFLSGLLNVINSEDDDKIELSEEVIYLFSGGGALNQEQVLKNMYVNQEKIGHKEIIVSGKTISPTIGNWLKDFIGHFGTGNFDDLSLSKYLTGSENIKNLDEIEKKLLLQLLIIYRNIKFFPEPFLGTPSENWDIFPLKSAEISDAEKRRAETRKVPTSADSKKLKELQEIAEQFAPGTLERRAVDEEIRKIS